MNDTPHATAGSASTDVPTRINASQGLAQWLAREQCSILFTTYQTGKVCAAGLRPDGDLFFQEQPFSRALGITASSSTVWVASLSVIWRLGNALGDGEWEQEKFDRLYQPRIAYITGDVDAHEIAVGRDGPVFVNTKYSCLATISDSHNFQPLWKPDFISRLLPEDRCHLNGLAMSDGEPHYVTAVSRSDVIDGWRSKRSNGGVLIDVRTNAIVSDGISIPHSPRLKDGKIWLLESGRGRVVTVDPATGAREDVVFCPGFLRGLSFHGDFALVTTSCPREGTFDDLELEDELKRRNIPAQCGVYIIDTRKRTVVEMLTFEGALSELFDVAVLPDVKCPIVEGPATPRLGSRHAIAPLGSNR